MLAAMLAEDPTKRITADTARTRISDIWDRADKCACCF